MERSKRSLNVRMKHDDDYGMNEDSNLSRLESDSVRASIKEDSQKTTTLTGNKNVTTKTKDLQCMKTHALASTTLTCSPSVSGHFTHCWVSLCTSCRQFLIVVGATIYSIWTCTRIPCRFTLRKRVLSGVVFTLGRRVTA